MLHKTMSPSLFLLSTFFFAAVVLTGMHTTALAADSGVPWECSNYTDEAQTRCLNAFIERQQAQIGQLQGRLQAQQEAMGQLKGQIDRQNAATTQLQQQLSQPPPVSTLVPPLMPIHMVIMRIPPWDSGCISDARGSAPASMATTDDRTGVHAFFIGTMAGIGKMPEALTSLPVGT